MQNGNQVTRYFIWQGNWTGGAERITLSMAQFLSSKGESVTLGVYQKDISNPLPQIIYRPPTLIPTSFRSFWASLRWRWRNSNQFDAVYSHTLGAWKTKRNRVFIHEAADLDTYLQSNSFVKIFASHLWKYLYLRFSLRPATLVFCATPETKAFMLRHGLYERQLALSASFYDEDVFKPCLNPPAPRPPYRLLFLGNYADPRKRFHLIKKYFSQNAEYEIHVAGGRAAPQNANIIYHGHCSPDSVYRLLCHCHIFILPSISEGFSIALLEALASGIPCVASRSAVHQELLSAPNLVTFTHNSELPQIIEEVAANWSHYRQSVSPVPNFTRTIVLNQEYEAMQQKLSASGTADKKHFSATAD